MRIKFNCRHELIGLDSQSLQINLNLLGIVLALDKNKLNRSQLAIKDVFFVQPFIENELRDSPPPERRERRNKILDRAELRMLATRYPGAKIVQCHGVFDVLHAGHLAYLESAKKFGDILVLTITADEFVNKGPGHPRFHSLTRAQMLAALEIVDYVYVNPFSTAVPAIEELKPAFYVKGPDYKDLLADVTGGIIKEKLTVEKFGGALVFTDDEIHSSSQLINQFFNHWSEDQQVAIEAVKRAGGLALIEEVFEKISRERVTIVGEPIVDTYVFCQPENISSKSPSISVKFLYQENYAGGSLAIANHVADFAKEVNLLITHGDELYFRELLSEKMDSRVNVSGIALSQVPTPRKTRFIAQEKSQRMFELTDLRSDQWSYNSPKVFCELLKKSNLPGGFTILADFGHGLLEDAVLEAANHLDGFVALNVQTNSSNFGFNPFNKYRNFSFLSIDTKEVRVAYHDRFTPTLELASRLRAHTRSIGAGFAMTLGPNGAYYLPANSEVEQHCPAFADSVVDATGAGDAFFSLTSLLVRVECPQVLIPFLGNVFAALKTKIIGNKHAVTRGQLVKALTSILK
jgi:cytidyltransferase-like protein